MAKKKTTNKGINLLNGITGSKLAQVITLAIVLLAIPITVGLSRQQQNIQQEAAISPCQKKGGYCINTDFGNYVSRCRTSGRVIIENLCHGNDNIRCCINPNAITPTPIPAKKTCRDRRGTCLDLNKYICITTVAGLCNGGNNIQCCTGNYWKK